MLSPMDLMFLRGWTHEYYPIEEVVYANQPTVLLRKKMTGMLMAFYFYTNDLTTTVGIVLDGKPKEIEVQNMYLAGYTQMNNAMPYISHYEITSGTAGNFVVVYNPANPIPLNDSIAVTAQLGSTSTQSSAKVYTQLLLIVVNRPSEFMESLREFVGAVLPVPASTSTSAPASAPSSSPKTSISSPFLYVP
ncbi:MAG: hypothetical protein ACP5ID_02890 [Conexivisphaera sp.]